MTAPTPPFDPVRPYDEALVAKLGAVTRPGENGLWATVAGLDAPVPVLFNGAEEWYKTFALPALGVKRHAIVAAPARRLPGFVGRELSTNPETPNTWNVQAAPPEPTNFVYSVVLAAASQAHLNRLIAHALWKLPAGGYGTVLLVDGKSIPFRQTGMRDKTQSHGTDGRLFIYAFDYTVEGWLVPSLECEKVPQILTVDIDLETHKPQARLHQNPPVPASAADEVSHIHIEAPEEP